MGYPQISKAQTSAFAKAWDRSGIKLLLDDSSIQFATDWANIVLKSYVEGEAAKAKKAEVNPPKELPAPPAQKSSIILTD